MRTRAATTGVRLRAWICRAALGALVLVLASCTDLPTAPPIETTPSNDIAVAPTWVPGCVTGERSTGAIYQVCLPLEAQWNGDLVVWGHGYVSPTEPLEVPDDDVEGTPVAAIVNQLGFAYAATSYRDNGLVARDAVEDLEDLVRVFRSTTGHEPRYSYLAGGSEGGLATALAIEQHGPFDGGMATCGPIGSFRGQVNHFGDFRVVFDYFFPGVMPGTAIRIPTVSESLWEEIQAKIRAAILADPGKAAQLIRVTRVPVEDPLNPASVVETVVDLLWYSFFATNDAREKLGGNPFDNRRRFYRGSDNDWLLNRVIARHRAHPRALRAMRAYETTGRVKTPAVTLHTVRDPIVPYWHELLYNWKLWRAGTRFKVTSLPTFGYGHCEFTLPEVVAGFAILVYRVSGQNLLAPADMFAGSAAQQEFLNLARQQGATPSIVGRLRPE